jgi:hypothetical protein
MDWEMGNRGEHHAQLAVRLRKSRDFILKYDKLLLAAGCGTMKIFNRHGREPAPSSSQSDNQRLREVLNEMRTSGELIDTVLVPTFSSSEVSLETSDESDRESGVDEVEHECNDGAGDSSVEPDNDAVEVTPSELGAHRVILAAAIPYLRDRAKG